MDSFAGVGKPHLRADCRPGETVLDLGSGAGLDAILASRKVGPEGSVIGVDLNPAMCDKARAHVSDAGANLDCRSGRMEDIPLEDASVDVVIANGVINLSFQKRKVIEESGFSKVKSAVVPNFRFKHRSTQNSAEAYGVMAVMFTAVKPSEEGD